MAVTAQGHKVNNIVFQVFTDTPGKYMVNINGLRKMAHLTRYVFTWIVSEVLMVYSSVFFQNIKKIMYVLTPTINPLTKARS